MRYVIYDRHLEPITVVELGHFIENRLREDGYARLAVIPELSVKSIGRSEEIPDYGSYIVEIEASVIRRGDAESMFLVTKHDELALRLRSEFLPGQRKELQDLQKSAFARGFLHALLRDY